MNFYTRSLYEFSKKSRLYSSKVFRFEEHFDGFPKETNLRLVEEKLASLKEEEFLCEAVYLSVDPYMRTYGPRLKLGSTFIGSQVAKIIESKNDKFKVGQHVVGHFGWRTHTVANENLTIHREFPAPMLVPDLQGLPLSYAIGVLGMPGNSAYFGLLNICKPKPGETVVVTCAGGCVGSLAGQIAKLQGCKVIGIAGSEEKGKWLINDLKFDGFINYKNEDVKIALGELAPEGVDCYFDNVGGEICVDIMNHMNLFGRIAICGSISTYNNKEAKVLGSIIHYPMIFKHLKMEGYVVYRWYDQWKEGTAQNMKWILDGKIQIKETITQGFENTFEAFTNMLKGKNIGKAIVKI